MDLHKPVMVSIILVTTNIGFAQEILPRFGGTHIVSRDKNFDFRGSHKLYKRPTNGAVEVTYCEKSYWVRYQTIAWTQIESDLGYDVQVEVSRGNGWKPICNYPAKQVHLKGLGVTEDPHVVVQPDWKKKRRRINPFDEIRNFFRSDTE